MAAGVAHVDCRIQYARFYMRRMLSSARQRSAARSPSAGPSALAEWGTGGAVSVEQTGAAAVPVGAWLAAALSAAGARASRPARQRRAH